MHKRLARFAAELVRIECVREVVVDVCRVECCDKVGESVTVCGLVEAAKGGIAGDVQFIGEVRGGALRKVGYCCEQLLMAVFEGALDALVELLIASRGFDGPYVASTDDGRIRGIKVEGEVNLGLLVSVSYECYDECSPPRGARKGQGTTQSQLHHRLGLSHPRLTFIASVSGSALSDF